MPLTLEDRQEITELVARYNQAIDGRDAEGYADTLVEDGVFQIEGQQEIKGRERLMRMVESNAWARPTAGTGLTASSATATAIRRRCPVT